MDSLMLPFQGFYLINHAMQRAAIDQPKRKMCDAMATLTDAFVCPAGILLRQCSAADSRGQMPRI
jgi:hypothetical protein